MKILKVFSLVIVLHFALLLMVVLQPGCNSAKNSMTVENAQPVGNSRESGLWVFNDKQTQTQPVQQVAVSRPQVTQPERTTQIAEPVYSELIASTEVVNVSNNAPSVYQETGDFYQYEVKKGDSLWSIAKNNGVSMRKLMSYNKLNESSRIFPDQVLLIPGKLPVEYKEPVMNDVVVKNDPVIAEPVVMQEPEAVVETPTSIIEFEDFETAAVETPAPVSEGSGTYEVQAGDSLYIIAMHNNTTVDAIKELNKMDRDLILSGQILRIPGKWKGSVEDVQAPTIQPFTDAFNDVAVAENTQSNDYLTHVVEAGDYPGSIARRYNMSIADLLHVNDIRNPRLLKVGTELKVNNPRVTLNQDVYVANETATQEPSEEAVAISVDEPAAPEVTEEAPETIEFEDFPVIRVGS